MKRISTRIKIIKNKTEFIVDDINEFFATLDEYGNKSDTSWKLLDLKMEHLDDREHSIATITYRVTMKETEDNA